MAAFTQFRHELGVGITHGYDDIAGSGTVSSGVDEIIVGECEQCHCAHCTCPYGCGMDELHRKVTSMVIKP